jgi:hypothetical protein
MRRALVSRPVPGNQGFNRSNFTLQDVSLVFRHLLRRLNLSDSTPNLVKKYIDPRQVLLLAHCRSSRSRSSMAHPLPSR